MGTPTRSCLSCRRRAEQSALVRLVVADGAVHIDPLARMPGRGAYLCGRDTCLEAALRRDAAALHRSLRTSQARVDGQVLRAAWHMARQDKCAGVS